jgi:hypothetical protein
MHPAPTPSCGRPASAGNRRGCAIARFGGCGDGGATDTAQGILGTLVLRKGTSGCVADVHASLFALAATGEVRTTRFDADGIPIGGMGDAFCLW